MPTTRTILITDADRTGRALLPESLPAGFHVGTAGNAEEALRRACASRLDVMLLDATMPGLELRRLCDRLKSDRQRDRPHIILMVEKPPAGQPSPAADCGADDYLVMPIDPHELLARLQLHFRLRDAVDSAMAVREEMEAQLTAVRKASAALQEELQDTQEVAMLALAEMSRCRDSDSREHVVRTRDYAQAIAERLAQQGPYAAMIDRQLLRDLYRSSPLHDIGKTAIRDDILLKPGPLTPEQYEQMKRHTTIGAGILEEAARRHPGGKFLAMAAAIARHHHERFDGMGYPSGLRGQEIPLPARIVTLADVYDAITSSRCYKPAYSADEARAIIERGSGTQFDPEIVAAFRLCGEAFAHIRRQSEIDVGAGVAGSAEALLPEPPHLWSRQRDALTQPAHHQPS